MKPDQNEYALKDYRNRTGSPAQLLSEMQLRPTVMPQELKEVRKHETVQKILKKKRTPEDKDSTPPPANDFLDNLVARNVKGQQPQKKAMT